jgi:Cof subfamily protein (haloacid dehalogenase superfamily)
MYKAVVTDLDGTLLNPEHQVSAYTRDVVQAICRQGVKFVIASGRHHADVRHISRLLDLEIFLVTSNGARVHDREGETIHRRDLDPDLVDDLLKLEVDDAIHVNVYKDDEWLVAIPLPSLLRYHAETGFGYQVVDFNIMSRQGVPKLFYHGDHNALLALEDRLRPLLTDRAVVTYSTPQSLEIMAAGVSKGAALEHVLRYKQIRPEETIAFGDGPNDIEMLRFVGKGILMDNASTKLKHQLGDIEIGPSNAEDGVARYLAAQFL